VCNRGADSQSAAPALMPALGVVLAWIALTALPIQAQDRFPDAEEKEQVTTTCSACHTLARVAANHRTEAQWTQTIKVHEGRGLKLDPEDAKPIVRYLAAYFGPLVNLNTATAAELAELPGVTKKIAEAIVQYRERHGPYQNVADVSGVEGFPAALLPKIRNRLSK
jgi:competence protein ComEA